MNFQIKRKGFASQQVNIVDYCKTYKDPITLETCDVYLGCDSAVMQSGVVCYAIVVGFRHKGRGVHFVHQIQRHTIQGKPNTDDYIFRRLMKEVELTHTLAEHLNQNGIQITGIDFDFNRMDKTAGQINKSHNLISMAKGMLTHLCLSDVSFKPDLQIATPYADKMAKQGSLLTRKERKAHVKAKSQTKNR